LKTHLGGGLAPSSQTVGSLLIPLASWPGKLYEHSSNHGQTWANRRNPGPSLQV